MDHRALLTGVEHSWGHVVSLPSLPKDFPSRPLSPSWGRVHKEIQLQDKVEGNKYKWRHAEEQMAEALAPPGGPRGFIEEGL